MKVSPPSSYFVVYGRVDDTMLICRTDKFQIYLYLN